LQGISKGVVVKDFVHMFISFSIVIFWNVSIVLGVWACINPAQLDRFIACMLTAISWTMLGAIMGIVTIREE
jgi:hypothetical protein